MKRLIGVLAAMTFFAAAAVAGPVPPSGCSNCIINSAVPQNAQVNLGTMTVRGTLTASTAVITNLEVTNLTVDDLSGDGSALTNLNASQLLSGTVPIARLAGSYTGITGVGTIAAGVWHGTVVGTQYGGTGQNWTAVATGALPYFSAAGTMNTLAAGAATRLLQANGSAAPSWTAAPSVLGTNITAIPLANLQTGNLPSAIKATDGSLVTVSGSKISGDIGGNAENINGDLPLAQLEAGTLPADVVASSITGTGVVPGTYPATTARIPILVVRTDGRVSSASQSDIALPLTQLNNGTLPAGILLPAASVASGALGSSVVASSLTTTGVTLGSYGGAAKTLTATVRADGRLSALAQTNIAIDPSQINAGPLPSNVSVPAANIASGNLGSGVVAQTLNASGVTAGTYGGSTQSVQLTVNAQGRVTSATQFTIPAVSTSAAWVDRYNRWSYPQTSLSSWTILNDFKVSGTLTSAFFVGAGPGITNLTPANFNAGTFPSNVIASSVGVNAIGPDQLQATAVTAGSYGSASKTVALTVDADGRITSAAQQTIAISTGELSGILPTDKGGTGNDWSATASGGVPYFSGTGALSVLAKSVNGYSLVQSAGVPAWAAVVSSATNLAGGVAGAVPYQSAANTTAFSAAGTSNQVLASGGTGSPTWTGAPTVLGTNITAIPVANLSAGTLPSNVLAVNLAGGGVGQHPYQSAAGTTLFLPAMGAVGIIVGNGTSAVPSTATLTGTANQVVVTQSASAVTLSLPQSINSGATPTFTGTNFSGIPAGTALTGQVPIANGGTALSSAGGTANRVLRTSDGSTFAMGQIIGPDIAGGTVPVSALNQSGAASTNVIAWNGSNWAPTAATTGDMQKSGSNDVSGSINMVAGSTFNVVASTSLSFAAAGSTITVLNPGFVRGGYGVIMTTAPAAALNYLQVAGLPTGGYLEMFITLTFPITVAGTSGGVGIRGVIGTDRTSGNYLTQVIDNSVSRGNVGFTNSTSGGCNFNSWQAHAAGDKTTYRLTVDTSVSGITLIHGTWDGLSGDGYNSGTMGCYYTNGNATSFALEFPSATFTINKWKIVRLGD